VILLCGIPSESPLAYTIAAAKALGVEHVVYNQRHAQHTELSLDVRDGRATGALWAWERSFPLERFTGVYARLLDSTELPETRPCGAGGRAPDARLVEHSAFLHAALNEWMEVTPCPVLNRTSAMASNGSKPYQAQRIAEVGLATPDTLVTNDAGSLRAFARHHGRVIYKSTSGVRSIVRELGADLGDDALARLRHLPTQFQQYIGGTNVRVHVVGPAVFATEVRTTAIDYRYAGRDELEVTMAATTLPGEVADRCRALATLLDLPLCGIDLKRADDGVHYCFEVNPSPAYSYYQDHTGQPIADAIVRFLAG
jgi:glutathione synthase/RimK-type ligase-like ATP-grasp enzyme